MSNELVDSIQVLINEGKGDLQRLHYMIDAIKRGKKLYDSDRKYVESLTGSKIIQKEKTKDDKLSSYHPDDENDIKKIIDHLEPSEKVLLVAKQSRIKPGGALTSPNTVFATTMRLIIRNPTMLGMRENVEDIPYDQITSVKIERGIFSSTIVIRSPGLSELSRLSGSSGLLAWGRGEDGAIDSLPKDKAEQLLVIIKKGMADARKKKEQATSTVTSQQFSVADELVKLAKLKEQAVITEEEFSKMKNDLIKKTSGNYN